MRREIKALMPQPRTGATVPLMNECQRRAILGNDGFFVAVTKEAMEQGLGAIISDNVVATGVFDLPRWPEKAKAIGQPNQQGQHKPEDDVLLVSLHRRSPGLEEVFGSTNFEMPTIPASRVSHPGDYVDTVLRFTARARTG